MQRLLPQLCLAALLLLGAPASGQVSPEVPAAAIETARRVNINRGYSVVGPPARARVLRLSPLTGQRVFEVNWTTGGRMEVDEASGRVIRVSGGRSLEHSPLDPSQPALTQDQVEVAALFMVARGEFPPGDWRALSEESAYFADSLGEGGAPASRPRWTVRLYRYQDEHICELDRAVIFVDAHDGRVDSYGLFDAGIRLPPSGPILAEAQARQIAMAAFQAGGGAADAVPELLWNPYQWLQVHGQSPLCRPAYWYRWYVDLPSFDPAGGLRPAAVEARVDAVTGELWSIGVMTGGMARFDSGRVPTARRLKLATAYLLQPATAGLGRALAAGNRPVVRRPGRTVLQFPARVQDLTVNFGVEPRARRLFWREPGGNWAATTLPVGEFRRLQAWLRRTVPAGEPVASGESATRRRDPQRSRAPTRRR